MSGYKYYNHNFIIIFLYLMKNIMAKKSKSYNNNNIKKNKVNNDVKKQVAKSNDVKKQVAKSNDVKKQVSIDYKTMAKKK